MPRRTSFEPQGKQRAQVQIHNLVSDPETMNSFVSGLNPNYIRDIADSLEFYTVNMVPAGMPFDPKAGDMDENDNPLPFDVNENDSIKSFGEYAKALQSIKLNPGSNESKKKLKDVFTFLDNFYGAINANPDKDMGFNMLYQKDGENNPTVMDVMKSHVIYINHNPKISAILGTCKKPLDKGFAKPADGKAIKTNNIIDDEMDVTFNSESSFFSEDNEQKKQEAGYKKAAENFRKPNNVMDQLKQLDDVYHQLYDISNRVTDSSEFKKMLGSLKEIHEVYTYYTGDEELIGRKFTGNDLVSLIQETAENTTKYIDKLGANNKYRSTDKGNTKLLGAVQILSTIDPEYTKKQYSNLKLKTPEGEKTTIVKNQLGEIDIIKAGENKARKITFDHLVEEARQKTASNKKMADNEARRNFTRMRKRASGISRSNSMSSDSTIL